MNKWQIGPVKLANGFDAVIHRFCEKRQRYIGELQDASGGWFSREWDANGWYTYMCRTAEDPYNLAPPPAIMNLLKEIARKDGRVYITPEDVGEAMKSHPAASVQSHLLAALSGRHGVGVEDPCLCAFIATVPQTDRPNPPQAPT